MEEQQETVPTVDADLSPKRRSHDRQYWDDRLKRYVDFETPAERRIDPVSGAPNRHERRKAAALRRSPEKRRHERNRGARLARHGATP